MSLISFKRDKATICLLKVLMPEVPQDYFYH